MGVQVPLSAPQIIKQLTGPGSKSGPFVFANCNRYCNHRDPRLPICLRHRHPQPRGVELRRFRGAGVDRQLRHPEPSGATGPRSCRKRNHRVVARFGRACECAGQWCPRAIADPLLMLRRALDRDGTLLLTCIRIAISRRVVDKLIAHENPGGRGRKTHRRLPVPRPRRRRLRRGCRAQRRRARSTISTPPITTW